LRQEEFKLLLLTRTFYNYIHRIVNLWQYQMCFSNTVLPYDSKKVHCTLVMLALHSLPSGRLRHVQLFRWG